MRLGPDRSLLLVVDVQERLLPVMREPAGVLLGCAKLVRGAQRLAVPVIASEQLPDLGPTVGDLKALLPHDAIRAKTAFSCAGDAAILARLAASGRDQIVVAGIEAHVGVLQTALDLKARSFSPVVVADATASRTAESRALALARLSGAGVPVVSVEMVLFEWLGDAGHPAYKDIAALIA